jgi:hypothetical protein
MQGWFFCDDRHVDVRSDEFGMSESEVHHSR